jgi:large subunit ribosomal protein L4
MELKVYNITGKDTGKKVNLNDELFGIEPNDHAIYLDVKQHMAGLRSGNSQTKERGEIIASTKKLKRQKGTGGARAGSAKSPTRKGGGRTFGPKPRDYDQKVNKKVKKLARISAFIHKIKNNNLIIVEDFDFEQPKTKQIIDLKKNFKIDDKKSLLVLPNENNNLYLSSRNLKDFDVLTASSLNTYEILRAQKLLVFESSLEILENNLSKS